jgi:hypothetical protein
MITLLLLILVIGVFAQDINQLPIRAGTPSHYTGVVKLQMGTFSEAAYSILYNKELPDTVYNSVVCIPSPIQ